ncbi:DNA-3-methyladenine glycosylase I [Frigidibacter mobilis]|uniref:DNA-3-methyladenine glycosylase I n=1 Tax=Frigidibacter mobilis TaxID=1335048 RepID=A0A159YYD5_9RHOB|nr:DNA-3-methyladenine glycosylase I [Frigidibacter mobilis]AMY67425.1 DNA-3-methyladenine glycosylase 1 [Frigidibacter mobilis]
MDDTRCSWCGSDPLYVTYHDEDWGVPEADGRALWEKLVLDGFQAGLAWITILRKRESFREVFQGFDPEVIAGWGEEEVLRLLGNPGIVRHRGKIEATIGNARAYLKIEQDQGFARFLWGFVGGRPLQPRRASIGEVPTTSPEAEAMSKALKKAGFRFCGPTIVYAFMQATGMVNDHIVTCRCHQRVADLGEGFRPG